MGASLEAFALDGARADDIELAKVFGHAGAKVAEFDPSALQKWKGDRARYSVEGFRRAQYLLRGAAETGREDAGVNVEVALRDTPFASCMRRPFTSRASV